MVRKGTLVKVFHEIGLEYVEDTPYKVAPRGLVARVARDAYSRRSVVLENNYLTREGCFTVVKDRSLKFLYEMNREPFIDEV